MIGVKNYWRNDLDPLHYCDDFITGYTFKKCKEYIISDTESSLKKTYLALQSLKNNFDKSVSNEGNEDNKRDKLVAKYFWKFGESMMSNSFMLWNILWELRDRTIRADLVIKSQTEPIKRISIGLNNKKPESTKL
jgi:hypothetical protein